MKRLGALALLALAQPVLADQTTFSAAQAVQPLLHQPLSARAAALGPAFEPLLDDSGALEGNPAGLSSLGRWELGLNYQQYLLDMTQQSVVVAGPWAGLELGFGLQQANYGAFDDRDATGAINGSGSLSDYAGRLAASVAPWNGLSLGLSAELATDQLTGSPASSGMAGLRYEIDPAWVLGLDGGLAFPGQGSLGVEPLSLSLGWRAAWGPEIHSLVALGGSAQAQGVNSLGASIELSYQSYALRAGYQPSLASADAQASSTWSLGLGAGLGDLRLDYAYLPLSTLGAANRLSLSYQFSTGTASTAPDLVESDPSLLRGGSWWLAVQGGGYYPFPYKSADLGASFQDPLYTASSDFSSDIAPVAGLSVGYEVGGDWVAEAGGSLQTPRHWHVKTEDSSGNLQTDQSQDLQPFLLYAELGRRWKLSPDLSLVASLQGGAGFLEEDSQIKIPLLGIDSSASQLDYTYEASPLLRLDRRLNATQSFGLEIGYRLMDFSSGGTGSTNALDFSGITATLRWTVLLSAGKPAAPVLAPVLLPQDAAIDANVKESQALELEAATARNENRDGDALSLLKKSTALDPASITAWRALGQLQLSLGMREDAVQSFEQALSNEPNDVELQRYVKRLKATLPP
jgi:hypothetical protein